MSTDTAERPRAVPRSTELTRQALIEAAAAVFAEHGYEGGSVRLITQRAKANQAAITYHFGGKDGLYREVLSQAVAMLEEQSPLDEATLDGLGREEALVLLLRQFLAPLAKRGRLGRNVRLFAWESVRPTAVFREFMADGPMPIFRNAERIVRRFLPADASSQEVALTLFWVVQQPIALVRDAERLAGPPYHLALDPASLEVQVERLVSLTLHGLLGRAPAEEA